MLPLSHQVTCTGFYGVFPSLEYEMAYLVSKINFVIFLQNLQIFMEIQIKCMIGHLFV
jgi:hypothetical protein